MVNRTLTMLLLFTGALMMRRPLIFAVDTLADHGLEYFEIDPSRCSACKTFVTYWGGPVSGLRRKGGSPTEGITVHYTVRDSNGLVRASLLSEAAKKTYEIFKVAPREEMRAKLCYLCKKVSYMLKSGGTMSISETKEGCLLKVTPVQVPIKKPVLDSTKTPDSLKFIVGKSVSISRSIFDSIINHPGSLKTKIVGEAISGSGISTAAKSQIIDVRKSDESIPRYGEPQTVDEKAALLHRSQPNYPPIAYANRIEGRGVLTVLLDIDGKVLDAKVVRSSNEIFNQDAIVCVKQWTFKPAIQNGKPVKFWYTDSLDFRIK